MLTLLLAGGLALVFSFAGTPLLIRYMTGNGYGQFIRDDGPSGHHVKRGTPSMGGIALVLSAVGAYYLAHLVRWTPPSASANLLTFLIVGIALVGFADDFSKLKRERSLGLRSWEKLIGQGSVATIFAVLALRFPDENGTTPASATLSWVRDIPSLDPMKLGVVAGTIIFVLWANIIVAGASNGVNLVDGLDGLSTGASLASFSAYVLMGIWMSGQNCATSTAVGRTCYVVRDPRDLAVYAAAITGACMGFLWWNASPAQIFMGDTGSLALGAGLAGLAMMTRTQLLLAVLGGLFVIVTLSVVIQVVSYKTRRKRVFKMTPLHHHFELVGWSEVTIVVRFWLIAALCVAGGLGIFYAEWVVGS